MLRIGPYLASKAALTSLSESLRLEVEPFGVRVVTAMIGAVDTNFYKNEPAFYLPPGSMYSSIRDTIAEVARGTKSPPAMDADDFAEALVKKLMKKDTTGKLFEGGSAKANKWMPSFVSKMISVSIASLLCTRDSHGHNANSYALLMQDNPTSKNLAIEDLKHKQKLNEE